MIVILVGEEVEDNRQMDGHSLSVREMIENSERNSTIIQCHRPFDRSFVDFVFLFILVLEMLISRPRLGMTHVLQCFLPVGT